MLSKLTVKPLLIACGTLFLALSILSVLYLGQRSTIAAQNVTIDAQAESLKQAGTAIESAADSNAAAFIVIEDLRDRLQAAIGEAQAVEEANQRARAALAAAERVRNQQAAELKRLKESIYETDANAAAWARQPLPGAIADQLQRSWEQVRRGEADHRGDPSSAVRGPGSRPAGSGAAAGAPEPGPPAILGLSGRLPQQPTGERGPGHSPPVGQ